MTSDEVVVTESGGTMRRFTEPLAPGVDPDESVLELQRAHGYDGPVAPADLDRPLALPEHLLP